MKILEMIDLIEKHEMFIQRNSNGKSLDRIVIKNKISDKKLLLKMTENKQYFLMLTKIRYRLDYLKDILKTHSEEVSDKQILYAIYLAEQDIYLQGIERRFDKITQKEMQELIKSFKGSCDRIIEL